jgi:diaminohydroxyphosphoribosylaminopyrimidine deaminase / 5-amino-6-(5-phosphoribosylamino)uracil reductase
VEAGHKLNGSLLREGLVDELLVYLAPKLLGQGQGMANFGPLAELSQALALDFISSERVGPDLRLVARVRGREDF